MNIDQNDNIITLTQVFDAPQSKVFDMFKNPAIKQWWGPTTWPVNVSDQDFVEGGSWHYSMKGPDDTEVWGKAFYEIIQQPDKIVYKDYFSDADGTIDTTLPVGLTTITLSESDSRTTLTMRGEYESADTVAKLIEMGMIDGVKDTWRQLDALVK